MAEPFATTTLQASSSTRTPRRDPAQNHGRNSAANYTGCAQVTLSCTDLQAGSPCPDCAEGDLSGKLYAVEAGVLIRLQGQPLIGGTRYNIEKLRCALCGQQYQAEVPPAIAAASKYDASCRSVMALAHYYFGTPFKRLETWQALQGIPLPDATQFDQMKALLPVVLPVYHCLVALAPEGNAFFYDDTPNRILSQHMANKSATRRSIYTTAMVSELGRWTIYLFSTSTCYARENVVPLLNTRQRQDAFFTMSDAGPMNLRRGDELAEHLLARWILAFCLVHGRRAFWELSETYPAEAEFVLEQISEVYRHERHCRQSGLSDEQRWLYHRKHSGPLMEALHYWLTAKLQFGEVESNSPLGDAMRYLLRYWVALTRFLQVPGAPLDNSLCERAIKVMIRYRRNSQYFRTLFGAQIGDVMMSVIHTAARNQINVMDYLNALQHHAEAVVREPEAWLPWNYQELGLLQAA